MNHFLQDLTKYIANADWAIKLGLTADIHLFNCSYLQLLLDECAICVKLSLYMLSNGVEFHGMPKQMQEKRLKVLETFNMRSIILFYSIVKCVLSEQTDTTSSKATQAQILIALHEILGFLNICSADNGSFLKLMLKDLKSLPYGRHEQEIHQCYHCLYGITLTLENTQLVLNDHRTTANKFEVDAATDVFETLEGFIIKNFKLKCYSFMNNEVKDCIEKVGQVFKQNPWDLSKTFLTY